MFVHRRMNSYPCGFKALCPNISAESARRALEIVVGSGCEFAHTGNRGMKQSKAEVLQGTFDLMVLQTLATMGPQHGYAIAARLEQISGEAIKLNMGTLYPGLMRLEQRGLVRAKWRLTETNRRADSMASLLPAGVSLERRKQIGTEWFPSCKLPFKHRSDIMLREWIPRPRLYGGQIGRFASCHLLLRMKL